MTTQPDPRVDPRLLAALNEVCGAFEMGDYRSAQAPLDLATDLILNQGVETVSGAANFVIWAYACAFLNLGEPRGASMLIQREQQIYTDRHVKVFCDLLHSDLAPRGLGLPPLTPHFRDIIKEKDTDCLRLVMAAMYKANHFLATQGEDLTKRRTALFGLLKGMASFVDPVTLYIALQNLQLLDHGPGYMPTPLRVATDKTAQTPGLKKFLGLLGSSAKGLFANAARRAEKQLISELNQHTEQAESALHERALQTLESARRGDEKLVLMLRSFTAEGTTQELRDPYDTGEHDLIAPFNYWGGMRPIDDCLQNGLPPGTGAIAIANAQDFQMATLQQTLIPRISLANDGWRHLLFELLERADAIVVWLNDLNPGVTFELEAIHAFGLSGKVILLDGRVEAKEVIGHGPAVIYPRFERIQRENWDRFNANFPAVAARLPNPERQIIDIETFRQMPPETLRDALLAAMKEAPKFVCDSADFDLYFQDVFSDAPGQARDMLDRLLKISP